MKIRLNFPVLLGFALLMALAVTKAHAQQAGASVLATCGTATYSAGSIYPTTQDTTGTLCTPGSSGAPSTVKQDSWTAVAGTQTALSIASATAPTVPATATILVFQPQGTNNSSGQCLIYRDDGTNPTGTTGIGVGAGQTVTYFVASSPIKFIAATGATCTVTITYYKYT